MRAEATSANHADWPCRKGCDDCCRHLASAPRVTREEWLPIAAALATLPEQVRQRIRESNSATCPLLDVDSGACLIYDARPVACRAYGFYAERESVLGCHRIELMGRHSTDVVWGNHAVLEVQLRRLGDAATLAEWLAATPQATNRRSG